MKDSFKNTCPLDGKQLSLAGVSEKICKKRLVLARKSVPSTRNEAFVEKCVSTIWKTCFFCQENQRKWFPLAEKYLSFQIVFP